MPITKLCISTNMKYKGGRGVGENVLDKTIRKDYRGGSGHPFILCNIPILLLWFNPFNPQN